MNDQTTEISDVGELVAEIRRLRDQVASLQGQVDQLDALAHQDVLCGLPNRRAYTRELERLIAKVGRYGESAAVLYVDFDGLKMINDSFGHSVGDRALIQVAKLLSSGLRKSDVVARVGGDEFAILLENVDPGTAQDTAVRLRDSICGCDFRPDDCAVPLSVAIGVAMISADDTPCTVMTRADEEMYRHKDAA